MSNKKFKFAASIVAFGISITGIAGVASANAYRAFQVSNTNSNYSIQAVSFAQAGTSDEWHFANMNYAVSPNSNTTFTFPGAESVCFYDIKVKFSDGYEQQFANVNVCRGDIVRAT